MQPEGLALNFGHFDRGKVSSEFSSGKENWISLTLDVSEKNETCRTMERFSRTCREGWPSLSPPIGRSPTTASGVTLRWHLHDLRGSECSLTTENRNLAVNTRYGSNH
jgi:hypothetical protein